MHHIELWTRDHEVSGPPFDWLLTHLGWSSELDADWPQGRTWHHVSGVYVVLEASPDMTGPHERTRAELNHFALRIGSREQLDDLRVQCVRHGWRELFADRYPHAGGPEHTALFIENVEGFEVEIVAD